MQYPLPHPAPPVRVHSAEDPARLFPDRKLLTKLCHSANRSLKTFFKTVLDSKTGKLGAVTAIQTFGDYGRWHPHLHLLVADGLLMPNGSAHVMPEISLKPLQELVRASISRINRFNWCAITGGIRTVREGSAGKVKLQQKNSFLPLRMFCV